MKKVLIVFLFYLSSNTFGQLTVAESPGFGDNMKIIGETESGIYVMDIANIVVTAGAVDKNSLKPLKFDKPQKYFTYTTAEKTKLYYNLRYVFPYHNNFYGIYHVTDGADYKKKKDIPCKIHLINISTLDTKNPKSLLLDETKMDYQTRYMFWTCTFNNKKGIINYGSLKVDGIHIYSVDLEKMEMIGEKVCDFGLKGALDINAYGMAGNFFSDDLDNFSVSLNYYTEKEQHSAIAYGQIADLENAKFLQQSNHGKGTWLIAAPLATFNNESRHGNIFIEHGDYPSVPHEFPRIVTSFFVYCSNDNGIDTFELALPEKLLKEIYTHRLDEFNYARADSTINGMAIHYWNKSHTGEFEICFELYTDYTIFRDENTIANGNSYFRETSSKGLVFCKISKNGEVLNYKMIPRDVRDSYSFHYFYNSKHYFFYNKTVRKENGKVSGSVPLFTVQVLKNNWEMEEVPYEATHLTNESKGTILSIGPEHGYISNNGKNVYFLGQCETINSGSSVLLMKYEMK